MKTPKVGLYGLTLAVLTTTVIVYGAAGSFFFIFNQTPYQPSEYLWTEPWEIKEVIDFVEATLTITGAGYKEESHDVQLVLKNVASEPNYVIISLSFAAVWQAGLEEEVIIDGSYSGALAVGESETRTGVFTPTITGVGEVKMSITNIVWDESESITWVKDPVVTGSQASYTSIKDFTITGATVSLLEPGNVAFTVKSTKTTGAISYNYKVEIIEASIVVAQGSDSVSTSGQKAHSFDFDPVPIGGTVTMRVTITAS